MEKVVHISLVQGTKPMDNPAPVPSHGKPVEVPETERIAEDVNFSSVSVSVLGCGGCGINLARNFKDSKVLHDVLYFDTSMTNSRHGEKVNIVTNGSGSGSDRASNAREIERVIPTMSDEHVGKADVAIVMFSLAGGSGSVIGPLLIRDLVKRGVRVIGVCVADTSYGVGAKNTLNTLKTLTAIANANSIYLPLIVLSNEDGVKRSDVDTAANTLVTKLVGILTSNVFEVDRNDRLNWINPSKVVGANPGLKLMSFDISDTNVLDRVIVGGQSAEMVDSLLVLQASPDEPALKAPVLSRLKKTGFYVEKLPNLIGSVSSDISAIESIIDYVEKMFTMEKAQKHQTIDRLASSGDNELIV